MPFDSGPAHDGHCVGARDVQQGFVSPGEESRKLPEQESRGVRGGRELRHERERTDRLSQAKILGDPRHPDTPTWPAQRGVAETAAENAGVGRLLQCERQRRERFWEPVWDFHPFIVALPSGGCRSYPQVRLTHPTR